MRIWPQGLTRETASFSNVEYSIGKELAMIICSKCMEYAKWQGTAGTEVS